MTVDIFDIEEEGGMSQFGALTVEQHVMVNAFAEMVRKGQILVPSGVPRHNEGDIP